MSGGIGFLDIIIFAMLAAFLIYRLGSVLGKRTGHEQKQPDMFAGPPQPEDVSEDNVIALPDRAAEVPEQPRPPETPLEAGIADIQKADQNFDFEEFKNGARAAFEMVVIAFGEGDTDVLRRLLSDEVYENFASAINDREARNQQHESTLVGIDVAEPIEASMDGRMAAITLKYVSEQVNATRDSTGEVVEGDPSAVVTVTDIWTFARDVSSSDPNWTLVATRSPN